MTHHSDESIRQLTETVSTLTGIVAKNENRFRWFSVALICLTMLVFYMGFNNISPVQAAADASGNGDPQVKRIADMMEQMMPEMSPLFVLLKRAKEDSDMLRTQFECPEAQPCGTGIMLAVNGILNYEVPQQTAGAQFKVKDGMNDMLRLVHRLRLDSDSLRKQMGISDGSGLFSSSEIHNDLVKIGIALSAVPAMAEEMHRMNMNMAVMARDMDSSMGRMGRMMPGGPGGWW
ncbi:MAG: hypothetical protein DRR00_33140 [Candidatus Parabeggiatoa sp. nov. 3]|nr:MAG: hypothetical protein DRR00_33140 [Gammaproteobacteria bacterium]